MKKKSLINNILAIVAFLSAGIYTTNAQAPTPQISNVASCIQVHAAGSAGTILIAPKLLNKLNVIDWALVLPGDSAFNNVSWNEVTYAPDGDSSAIVAVVPKSGAGNEGKFYVIYADSTLALGTATANGLSTPVKISQNIINYYQLVAGASALYLITTDGFAYTSVDGGQSWQPDTGNASANGFIGLVLDTFQNAYAMYSPGGTTQIYKQDAGAASWHVLSGMPGGQIITGLYADRRGYIFVSTYQNGIYCSKDTGNTFTVSSTVLTLGTTQLVCDDAFGNIYVSGGGGNQLYSSSDIGVTWEGIGLPITNLEQNPANTFVINSIAGDSVITASTIYGMFASRDFGNTWIQINQGLHETQFDGFFKSPAGRLVETTNNGVFYADAGSGNFTNSFPATGYQYAGSVYNDTLGNIYTNAYAYGGSFGTQSNMFYKSADYGATWQADTLGLAQLNRPTVFGVDEFGNVHTAATGVGSFGALWPYNKPAGGSFAPDTAGIGDQLGSFVNVNAFESDDNGNLFMGAGGNASHLVCWKRPIGGGTWVLDTAGLPPFTVISYLTRDTSHNIIALAAYPGSGGGQIYYHRNGVWSGLSTPDLTGTGSGDVVAAAVTADNTGGILVAMSPSLYYGGYGVYCTHDMGVTWNYVGLYGTHVYALYSFGDTTYAMSDRGIYALTCSGVLLGINQPEQSIAANLSLYPNPTQGDCNAVFTLPATAAKSELDIVDISGRTLKIVDIPTGANTLNFSTGDLSRGVYLCVLKSDEAVVDVRRLVVVR